MIRFTKVHGLWLWTLALLLYSAAAQLDGYISIDCGATSNFTDTVTGIQWSTDDGYIGTGENKIVKAAPSVVDNERQMQTLRYFPSDRRKHCYILPAVDNSSYVLRAMFLHSDFQPPSSTYKFEVSIDSTLADTITIGTDSINVVLTLEYVVVATSDHVSFCLLPVSGKPMISSLEFRPLATSMYDTVYEGRYLKTITRLNCGANRLDPTVRYPEDPYDRLWYSPGENFAIPTDSTDSLIPITDEIFDKPPLAVMQNAWLGEFWWFTPISQYELLKTTTYYNNLFFAEVQKVKTTDLRSVALEMNNVVWVQLNVTLSAQQAFQKDMPVDKKGVNFSASSLPQATLPPLLNAAEIYASREASLKRTNDGDVAALNLVKDSLGLSSWTGDPCLPIAYDWLTCDKGSTPRVITLTLSNMGLVGTIPAGISDLTAVTDLWLDNNKISGEIPDLSKLKLLKTLHLQKNSLAGGIPESFASLPVLAELNLSDNQLSGPIPAALEAKNGLKLLTSGNVELCPSTGTCKIKPAPGPGGQKKKSGGVSGAVIGGAIGGVVVILIILVGLLVCFCRRRKPSPLPVTVADTTNDYTGASNVSSGTAPSNRSMIAGGGHVHQARGFTLAEVQQATNGYKRKIGEGGFGPVYYGRLPDGTEVAVKVNSESSRQGTTEFINEVSLLSRVHHKNLVSLLGYCEENGQQILIYEFMANGTLREYLYGKDKKGDLSWKERLNVAFNAAKGLEYLHNDCIPKIIHRDIKSNNILLNDKLMAKVADFGISKLAPDEDQTNGVSTIVRGTTGYLDPEYYAHNRLTHKSDVYSFGVVLLEIICGRPPNSIAYTDTSQYNLIEFARGQLQENNLEAIVDPAIQGTYNVEAMWKVAELAMGSVEPYGVNRPDMKQVVKGLTEALEFEEAKTPGGRAMPTFHDQSANNTETSYPSTHTGSSVSSIPEYTDASGGKPANAPLFTPTSTFMRLPSDSRGEDSGWMNPKPR